MNGVAGEKKRGPRFSVRQRVWLFSILGVVLLVGGFVIYREIEKRSVLKTHSQLMALLVEGKNEEAYRLTTRDYQTRHSLQEFAADLADLKNDRLYLTPEPTILSCYFGSAEIFAWRHEGMFEFLNGPSFYYRKEDGQWRFTGETSHYLD
jgi:hypothetical protein